MNKIINLHQRRRVSAANDLAYRAGSLEKGELITICMSQRSIVHGLNR